ncbi:hypothetical protein [Candidatus Poriferisodalis sp.]|uniref:hypothetical protein n=1 Tax=Candidatus Poriferisodalis sp. TaxID=3101277 RepID=UPI003B027052
MTGSAPRSLPSRNTGQDSTRDVVEAWLRAGGSDPLALQADLTAAFIAGDETALGFEVWRLVCEANETGWADDRLCEALSRALADDMQQAAAGASLSD